MKFLRVVVQITLNVCANGFVSIDLLGQEGLDA
jgi:hypothetical protein